jgi:hypothetical protein
MKPLSVLAVSLAWMASNGAAKEKPMKIRFELRDTVLTATLEDSGPPRTSRPYCR